jgi:hypothetical protein
LESSVHAEHGREFDDALMTLRAELAALTGVAPRMAQATMLPLRVLNASAAQPNLSNTLKAWSFIFGVFFLLPARQRTA